MADPICIVVLNYQTERQAFWNGHTWAKDASDAESLTWDDARKIWKSLEWKSIRIGTVNIVESYGLESERIAL